VLAPNVNVSIVRDATLASPVVIGKLEVNGILSYNDIDTTSLVHRMFVNNMLNDTISGEYPTNGLGPTSMADLSPFEGGHVAMTTSTSVSYTSLGINYNYTISAWIRTTSVASSQFIAGWRNGPAYSGLRLVTILDAFYLSSHSYRNVFVLV
jgi:hypothetical protein